MSTQITCDYCGLAVEPVSLIRLEVQHHGWMAGQMSKINKGAQLAPQYGRKLDLHLDCYLEHYEPTINQEPGHDD